MKQKSSKETHTENDLIGSHEIPESTLYGVQTLRNIESFRISEFHLNKCPLFIRILAITKMGTAVANHELDLLTGGQTDVVLKACKGILEGKHHGQLPVDMVQGGAGTTTNMNTNEVIANCVLELAGHAHGGYYYCSPNDHVNRSQSASDTYLTAIHIGLYYTHLKLVEHFATLIEAFRKKGAELVHITEIGCTRLGDAVPTTLGRTFNRFASILERELKNLDFTVQDSLAANMGVTAIGTGVTAEPEYAEKCTAALCKITGLNIKLANDLVGATSDTSCMVGHPLAMWRVTVKVNKVCNDLRLLASGPRYGLREINLPVMQPGSPTMPGKVNPVISGVMDQVPYKVTENNLCAVVSREATQMELNAMEPVIAQCCSESADLLMNSFDALRTLCIDGITANEEKCRWDVRDSIGVVTTLNSVVGYKHSTKITKETLETGKGVYELALEHNILSEGDLDMILKPGSMIKPVKLGIHPGH